MRPLPPLPAAPMVSVVVVGFNSASFLPACLRSVYGSDYSRIEVIVVDNASTDGSVRLVAEHFPAARIVRNAKNLGFAAANNQGFKTATGHLVLMLNPDTEVEPTAISAFVDGFRHAQADGAPIAIAGCKILDPDGETLQHAGGFVLENALTGHVGARELDTRQYDAPRECEYVTACAFCFPRTLLDRIGLFDEDYFPAYFEELDFCVRVRGAGLRVVYLPQPRVRHHESVSTGLFSRRFFTLYHRGRLRFVLLQFPLRRLLLDFPAAEGRWLRSARPKDQIVPLLSAYTNALIRLPKWWAQRCVRRQHFRRHAVDGAVVQARTDPAFNPRQ